MQRYFWDTNQYIYLFEKNLLFYQAVVKLRERMVRHRDELITSTVTLGEIQVKALAAQQVELAQYFKLRVIESSSIVAFDSAAADAYAYIRSTTRVKGPDAFQLACAMSANVDFFITNDRDLHNLQVPGIGIITSATALIAL